ncbi:hypothetical protein JXO59_02615 [candidate division KSB1 bacterium]|nr:hypothetical protein [candidate division KSB1 bacterium]
MPAPKDQWFARDKADHFMVSAFLTGCAYYAAQKEARLSESAGKNFAVGFSLSLGIFKEVYDGLSGKGNASFKDLGADALGTGLGYLMCTIGTK